MEQELTETMNIRFSGELMSNLVNMAELERRPVSTMARLLIEEAIAARANEKRLLASMHMQDVKAKKVKNGSKA